MTAESFHNFVYKSSSIATMFLLGMVMMVALPLLFIVAFKYRYSELTCLLGLILVTCITWFVFELDGQRNNWSRTSQLNVVMNVVSTVLDTVVASQICYIYLKMTMDLNFLFNKDRSEDDAESFKQLEARKKRLFWLNCLTVTIILALLYPAFMPKQINEDQFDVILQSSIFTNLSL